jgi:glycerophosphoryl diester phosphodiesterase
MSPFLENLLLTTTDNIFSIIPQHKPSPEKLENCQLVSHRGERDDVIVFENTFAAFDPVVEHGIWGIELDVRWTKDLVPVVIHDPDGLRVFGNNFVIAEHTWQECQQALPLVPSLTALVERYGKRCHLMIELKEEPYPELDKQKQILKEVLSPLLPEIDFHIIALAVHLLEYIDFLPKAALLPVSTTNAQTLSALCLSKSWGGLTGHYLFMNSTLIKKHKTAQQKVGCGFANSKNVLFREINKNADWIFSNQALAMHNIIQRHR